ncbi:MAG: ATP-binding protein [Paludibacteraceae bacterium]|nr:ATP-binding protein [Paludibacteraceae bacterium]
MEQTLKNLPIGIQDFESLINDGYLYVDKTALMHRLVSTGRYYFLSRPRRFGKSLLISTLKAYFLGKKDLFEGLAVEQLEQKWTVHPVLHLDLNTDNYDSKAALDDRIALSLDNWEKLYGRNELEKSFGARFEGVIQRAYEKTGERVVILVDEYDKPLLQAIGDDKLQDTFRTTLKSFYGALKSKDDCIKFAMLTGVTKFGKVSVFSDLNNLKDISLDNRYYNLCGIDEKELHGVFEPYVQRLADSQNITLDEAYSKLKRNYDGYHFSEDSHGMYNPFSVLNAFDSLKFGSYWFETGTPSYLVELLKKHNFKLDELKGNDVTANVLSAIDASSSNPIPVIFQSGYLTISGYDEEFKLYSLDFPNEEVREGFMLYLMPYYTSVSENKTGFQIRSFVREVKSGDITAFMTRLESFFANTPYDLIKDTENHYQNVLFILCNLCGLYTKAEFHTSNGRVDMTIETPDYVYIFEFKYNGTAEEAMAQIKEKNYALPFLASGKKIALIGANFSGEKRNIDEYLSEWL